MATTSQALTVPCPVCNARTGHPCTTATGTGRRSVTWVHLSRETAYLSVDRQDFFLTFGVQYHSQPHPTWPECNPSGWVRISAPTYEDARAIAVERFGLAWSMLTPSANFTPGRFYPAGELMVLP